MPPQEAEINSVWCFTNGLVRNMCAFLCFVQKQSEVLCHVTYVTPQANTFVSVDRKHLKEENILCVIFVPGVHQVYVKFHPERQGS